MISLVCGPPNVLNGRELIAPIDQEHGQRGIASADVDVGSAPIRRNITKLTESRVRICPELDY